MQCTTRQRRLPLRRRSHRWRFAVGWDRDGAVANLYGVAVCPHITFASWHGRVLGTSFGAVGDRDLDRRVEAAVTASTRAGWPGAGGG